MRLACGEVPGPPTDKEEKSSAHQRKRKEKSKGFFKDWNEDMKTPAPWKKGF